MLTRDNRIADCSLLMDNKHYHVPDHNPRMDNCTGMRFVKTDNAKDKRVKTLAFKQVSGHEEEMQTLKNIMKALGITMAAFGICHFEKMHGNRDMDFQRKNRPKTILGIMHSMYCYVVLILFCGYFVRSVSAFFVGEDASENFTFRIIIATWSLQITANVFILTKASLPRLGYQELACRAWDSKVLPLMDCLDVKLNMKRIKTIVSAIVVAGWSAIVLNICLIPVMLFKKDSNFSDAMANTLIAPLQVNLYTKLFVCVFTAFETVAWIVPVMYLMALCFIVQSAFKACSLALRNTVENGRETNTYPKCLYRQRMLHLNISKCLDLMDKDFKYLFANMFFTNIPLACFILYHMLKTDTNTMNTTVLTFWLVTNILFVTLATLSGATINTMAHSPLEDIYDVGMQGITLEELGQLHLFTSKPNGHATGFTVMTFVTVTKELFLTVGGLYLTYFFVLLQF